MIQAGLRRWRRPAGFTLLELVLVITVLGILAGAVTPALVQQVLEARISATQEEVEALHESIMGRPIDGVFGFVGDIGRLPATLQELTQIGGLPAYTTGTMREVGMGWRGPYANSGTSANDYLADAFGRSYTLSAGRVRSAGPDGVFNNADDIVYPPSAPIISGTVAVTLRETSGNPNNPKITVDPSGYRVELYYPNNGAEVSMNDASPPYGFASVPMGLHAVRVVKTSNPQAGSIVSEDTIVVHPGATTVADLWF